jgi:hypothetical protein
MVEIKIKWSGPAEQRRALGCRKLETPYVDSQSVGNRNGLTDMWSGAGEIPDRIVVVGPNATRLKTLGAVCLT